jgi:hypothetical protein
LFTLNLYQIPQGTGSGFVWDTKGNIITNFSRYSECRCSPGDLRGSIQLEGAGRRRCCR